MDEKQIKADDSNHQVQPNFDDDTIDLRMREKKNTFETKIG